MPSVLALTTSAPAAFGEETDTQAFRFSLDYTTEVWTTFGDAAESGAAYLDNLDAVLELDFEHLFGWRGTSGVIYGLYNNGREFGGRYVGDFQGVSNIETGVEAARIFEAFVVTEFGAQASLLIGLFDLNSEFDALETSGLFIHSAHGIGTDIAQTGLTGPSIFPVTSLAVRFDYRWSQHWLARAAVLDAVPGEPAYPKRTTVKLDSDEGALVIGEVERSTGTGKVLAGAWRYTGAFGDGLENGGLDAAHLDHGNHGVYFRGEWRSGSLAYFARLGWAAPRFNLVEWYVGMGVVYDGAATLRAGDRIGLALAHAKVSEQQSAAAEIGGGPVDADELAIELTYEAPLNDRFAIQFDLQFVANPGFDDDADVAKVAGLRFVWSLF